MKGLVYASFLPAKSPGFPHAPEALVPTLLCSSYHYSL